MGEILDEIRARRVVIVDPTTDRPRVVMEVSSEYTALLTVLTPRGEPGVVVEVDSKGTPRVVVGDPDGALSVEVENRGFFLWSGGNVVAALRSREEGGALDLCDPDGVPVVRLPDKRT